MIFRSPTTFLLLLPALVLVWLLRGTFSRMALVLRGLLLATLIAALAQPVLPGTAAPPPLLVLVDQSASLTPTQRTSAWQAAQRIASQRGTARTVLAAIGAEVRVVAPGETPQINAEGSDITGALRLAEGFGGRALLLTEGSDAAAQALRQAGIVVDVVDLSGETLPDARVVAINLPVGVREGQRFAADIVLEASANLEAVLHLAEDGVEQSAQPVQLKPGRTTISFNGRLSRTGIHTFRATLELSDTYAANNVLDQTVLVGPTPKVLVIERTPDSAIQLRDVLEQGGIQSEARRPADVPTGLSDLSRFDAVVLDDIAATDLSLDQQATLREYVRSAGRGLLALGGNNSFGLGDYKNTPLETVLPVEMAPPPRRERQEVALLLIVDRSASMYGRDPSTNKLALAKSAALAATQALVPNDRIGVVMFDNLAEYAVDFTQIGVGAPLQDIQDRINAIDFGGGTNIYDALVLGLTDLAKQPTLIKHAVLLTDGRSYARGSYEQLMTDATAAGITLSTIAIGSDADTELLERLALLGNGRYHFAADPQELPRLTLQETEVVRTDPRVEGSIQPVVERAHPAVRGLVPLELPALTGYVATTIKPTADAILQSPDGDVILAGWQYGLGRALAWTSDSGATWGAAWQQWPDAALFWTQALAYTFPDPANGPLTLRVTGGPAPELIAEAVDDAAAPLDLANVAARITAPDGSEQTIALRQIAPGRYAAALPALATGGYRIGVGLRKGSAALTAELGYVRAYPAEYAQRPDAALLARIAATTGGAVITTEAALTNTAITPPRPDRALWPWLVGAAIALWLSEIAVRRGWVFARRER